MEVCQRLPSYKYDINNIKNSNLCVKQLLLLAIQFSVHILFVTSHFLGWATAYDPFYPPNPKTFVGMELDAGMYSFSFLNPLFFFAMWNYVSILTKDHTKKWLIHNLIIIGYSMGFLFALDILHRKSPSSIDQFIIGFYLWIISAIITIAVLILFNYFFYKHRVHSYSHKSAENLSHSAIEFDPEDKL